MTHEMGLPLLPAILNFVSYFCGGLALLGLFAWIYARFTPYDELHLIKQGNLAASITFGGALLGFSLPLTRAIEQSYGPVDLIIWAGLALVIQLATYFGMARLFPQLPKHVRDDHRAQAILVVAISIIVGLLNAASMTE